MRERLSVYDVAKRYGKSVGTVYAWINKGLTPPLNKMGAQSFFYLDEIEQWEDSGCPPQSQHKSIQEEAVT